MNAFAILTGGTKPKKIRARRIIFPQSERKQMERARQRRYNQSAKGRERKARWREKNKEVLKLAKRIWEMENAAYVNRKARERYGLKTG